MEKKTVLITGASGLLGRTLVKHLLDNNYQVIATDINPEILIKDFLKSIYDGNSRLKHFKLDITSEESIREVINQSILQRQKIDVLINCAYPRNSNYGKKLEHVNYEDFCDNISRHIGGYYLTTKIFCEYFLEQGAGNVINLSSIYGTLPPRFSIYEGTEMTMPVEYSAIKSSIIQLTKYFAQYYKKQNIRANCVSPGGIIDNQSEIFINQYQEFTGLIGLVSASQVSEIVRFLSSDSSIGITGQNIIIDDGFSL